METQYVQQCVGVAVLTVFALDAAFGVAPHDEQRHCRLSVREPYQDRLAPAYGCIRRLGSSADTVSLRQ